MICKRCSLDRGEEFYKNDKTCKECRREMARENRARNAEYYREYDRERYRNDPRVKDRLERYQSTERGKAAARRAKDNWKSKNPVKRAANVILGNAVRDGRVVKPGACSECGASGRIHGHHDDYSKPLHVRWLCSKCHSDWHKENGEGKNSEQHRC